MRTCGDVSICLSIIHNSSLPLMMAMMMVMMMMMMMMMAVVVVVVVMMMMMMRMMMMIMMMMMMLMILMMMMASVGISRSGCHASPRPYPRQLRRSGFPIAIGLCWTIRSEVRGPWTELKSVRW